MNRRRSLMWLGIGLLVAGSSLLFITLSIGHIRAGVWFHRILDRIERDGPTDRHLADAAEYARGPSDWRRLMRIAWNLEEDRRWVNIAELAHLASEKLPRDDTWKLLSAYGRIRTGRFQEAQHTLDDIDSSSELYQMIRVLAVLDPAERSDWYDNLANLSNRPERDDILRTIGTAVQSGSAEDLYYAGLKTEVPAFLVNSGIAAASTADRPGAVRAVTALKEASAGFSFPTRIASVYLATWLRDSEWFFSLLSDLGGRRSVEPDTMAMHGDFLLTQKQYREAENMYQELRRLYPEFSAIPFINGAILRRIGGSEDADELFRQGLTYHRRDYHLHMEYAAYLVSRNRKIEAVRVLLPAGFSELRDGRQWLLIRAVLGPRSPVERLEADAWTYLNEYPEDEAVATFLANMFLLRRDSSGLEDLRRRYPPETAEWARILHAIGAVERGEYSRAETLLAPGNTPVSIYNYALFILRHGDLFLAAPVIEEGRKLAEEKDDSVWRSRFYMLLAEHSRLIGNMDKAIEHADTAVRLNPDNDTVYTYRMILARNM